MRRTAVVLLLGALPLLACSGGDDRGDEAAFCERLDDLARNDPFAAFGPRATSDEIAAAFDALVERADELLDVAPPEARGAARDYAESATTLDALLDEAGHDPSQVDVRAYRDAEITYTEASARLENHLAAEC